MLWLKPRFLKPNLKFKAEEIAFGRKQLLKDGSGHNQNENENENEWSTGCNAQGNAHGMATLTVDQRMIMLPLVVDKRSTTLWRRCLRMGSD